MAKALRRKPRAAGVLYAATAGAFRVIVTGDGPKPLDVVTGGNSRVNPAAFVPPENGLGLDIMKSYARREAHNAAARFGLEPHVIAWDDATAATLTRIYG